MRTTELGTSTDKPQRFQTLAVDKRSLADEVVLRLRAAIWSGDLPPGERLVEPQLARLLGVSRGPIREALDELEREGLVVKERNKTARVARLSDHDLKEVFSLRLALERLALEEAIDNAEPADLAALQEIINAMRAALETAITEQEAADLDMRFHEGIVRASKHQRLFEFWKTLRSQIYVFLLQIRALLSTRNEMTPDFMRFTVDQHQKLLDAIRAGDKTRAVAEIEEHIQESYQRIVRGYRLPDDGYKGE